MADYISLWPVSITRGMRVANREAVCASSLLRQLTHIVGRARSTVKGSCHCNVPSSGFNDFHDRQLLYIPQLSTQPLGRVLRRAKEKAIGRRCCIVRVAGRYLLDSSGGIWDTFCLFSDRLFVRIDNARFPRRGRLT